MYQVLVPLSLDPRAVALPPTDSVPMIVAGETMGTNWRVTCFAKPEMESAEIETAVGCVFADVIAEFSNWDDGSFVSRFNRSAAGSVHHVSEAFREVYEEALKLKAISDGAFNPFLGGEALSLGYSKRPIISPGLRDSGPHDVPVLSGEKLTKPAGVELDLSAVAKGYAVDRIAAVLKELGLRSFLAEIGGEFVGYGVKPDGLPWWVDIEGNAQRLPYRAALCGLALATSGRGNRHYHTKEGPIDHIVGDPTHSLNSVTVIAESCMAADGLATTLMALGLQKGAHLARTYDVAALMVPVTGEAVPSPQMAAMLR